MGLQKITHRNSTNKILTINKEAAFKMKPFFPLEEVPLVPFVPLGFYPAVRFTVGLGDGYLTLAGLIKLS